MRQRYFVPLYGAALALGAFPGGLAAGLAGAARPDAADRFAPPTRTLVLTRTLWRSLQGGEEIMVRRRYAVRFVPGGAGYILTGRQLDAAVDAPPKLAPLAAIERSRSDDAAFPIRLDRAGRIVAPAAAAPGSSDSLAAIAAARALIRDSAMTAEAKQEASRQIEQLAAAAAARNGAEDWPADLFSPLGEDWSDRRTIDLPGGGNGAVAVTVRYIRSSPGSLPSAVERTVTTELGGTTRISREVWTITVS